MSDLEPVAFIPRRLRILSAILAVGLCALCAVGWFALPMSLRETFNIFQRVTLLLVLAAVLFTMAVIAGSYVRADEQGLALRNGLRSYRVGWAEVHKIILRPGDPWALLLLKPSDGRPFEVDLDAEKRQLMGIQSSDGARATSAVQTLRDLHQRYVA